MIQYTLYPSIYDIDRHVPVREAWTDLVARFSEHHECARKDDAPGFGPYVLTPPARPCRDHRGEARVGAHRCDFSVAALTLAVFDVDVGTLADVEACDGLLYDVARVWYSSWSYDPAAPVPALRLVLPLTRPVPAHAWPAVRAALIARYRIPADAKKCSGASHFYYGPACRPGADRLFHAAGSAITEPPIVKVAAPLVDPGDVDFDDPADDPATAVDLEPIVAAIRRKSAWLARAGGADERQRGVWLRRVLDGQPIEEHGNRNDATTRTIQTACHAAPDATVAAMKHVFRQSVDAMIAAGSRKVTWDGVERLIISGLRRARRNAAARAAIGESLGSFLKDLRASRKPPPSATKP